MTYTTPENIINFILSFITLIILFRFYLYAFGIKKNRNKLLIILTILTFLIFQIILYLDHSLNLPPIILVLSFPYLSFYKKNYQKKLILLTLLLSISMLWLLILDLVTNILPFSFTYWSIDIFLFLGIWIAVFFFQRTLSTNIEELSFSLWLGLLSVPLISILSMICMTFLVMRSFSTRERSLILPVYLALLFINILIVSVYSRLTDFVYTKKEKALMEQQVLLQGKHYKELNSLYDQYRKINHDAKNHLLAAGSFLTTDESNVKINDEVDEYFSTLKNKIQQIENIINTQNPYLDSILNYKFNEAKMNNISLTTDINIPSLIKLGFDDVSTIFGNLLDNAIEACVKLPKDQRRIHLKLSYISKTLFMRIENSCQNISISESSPPVTNKQNKLLHGIGLKNVIASLENKGTINISSELDTFIIRIAIFDV